MANDFLIIDIDATGVNAQVIDISRRKRVVKEAGRVELHGAAGSGEEEKSFDDTVKSMLQQMDITGCSKAIFLVPDTQFFFRNSKLPFKAKNKVRQILPLELRAKFPRDIDEMMTDMQICPLNSQKGMYWVLSASITESEVKTYHDSLLCFGIRPCVITPKGVALAACFIGTNKEKTDFIFLYLEAGRLTMTLVAESRPAFVRIFDLDTISPQNFPKAANQTLLGFEQRTGHRICYDIFICGADTEPEYTPIYESLGRIVDRRPMMDNNPSSADELPPELTRTKVDPASLLSLLSPNREIPSLFNFCQGQYGSDSFINAYSRNIILSSLLALVAFILFMVNIYTDLSGVEKEVTRKNKVIESIFRETFPHKKINNLDPLLLMQASINEMTRKKGNKGDIDPSLTPKGIEAGIILSELSKQIPRSIDWEASRLILDEKRMILSGSADNFKTIDKAKGMIEKSSRFKKVEISSAVAGKGANRVNFKFIVEM